MILNNVMNRMYWTVWSKLPTVSFEEVDDEQGITTLEWIGMGMVMVVMLMIFWNVVKSNTESKLAEPIITKLGKLITDAFNVRS